MKLEQERGISVTSSVMQFEYDGYQINLLDTPGHEDFSEDTYRTLVAADSAVMLLDNRKGVEDRTRQLFDVCKTPADADLHVRQQVRPRRRGSAQARERRRGRSRALPAIRSPGRFTSDGVFVGVYDRRLQTGASLRARRRPRRAPRRRARRRAATIRRCASCSARSRTSDSCRTSALLDEAGHPFDEEAVLAGELSPVFFGSALTNFGVEPFLREFLELAPGAGAARIDDRHRRADATSSSPDSYSRFRRTWTPSIAIASRSSACASGRFEAGMQVKHVRTGKIDATRRRRSSSWRASARRSKKRGRAT